MELMRAGQLRSVERWVDAPAEQLYALVSDVTRTGEWSPECRSAHWLDGATGPAVGARFRGTNRWGLTRWARTCEVTSAEPGKEFAFRTVPERRKNDSTLWRYTFEPAGAGTLVTESYEIVLAMAERTQKLVVTRLLPHHFDMRPHMARTLERLDEAATGARPSRPAARGPRVALRGRR